MKRKNEWIVFVARRFGSVDSKGRSALTSLLSSLGIAFGVTALIVILSVMNGFQMGYIESILEVSSAHIRLTGPRGELERIGTLDGVRALTVFTEAQTLIRGNGNREQGALLRAVPADVVFTDRGFASKLGMASGSFDIEKSGSVVLGYELARLLSVSVGDRVSLVAVSGGSDTDLFPENPELVVRGLCRTGYYAIDSSYAFVSPATGEALSGKTETPLAGVKLVDPEKDAQFLSELASRFPGVKAESWRSYNRAFFGALRMEKSMLFLLVILIFVVVTVNIYNAMRRSVYERREEISVLTALGGRPGHVQRIFIANGLAIGLSGGLSGLLLGLFVTVKINSVFALAENAVNGVNDFVSALFASVPGETFTLFSPEYFYMDQIPVRMLFPEILFVFLFGVLSATAASWLASKAILKLKPAEVLRYE